MSNRAARDPQNDSVDLLYLPGTKRQQTGQELARIAAKQHGVVALRQLQELGLSAREVRGLVTAGHLHRLYRGVYAVGHVKLTRYGRLKAALLAAGPGAFLSHRTAAALRGLRNLNLKRIEITVVGNAVRSRPGIVIHRTTVAPVKGEVSEIEGLAVSAVPRLLVELAPTETEAELLRLIEESIRKGKFNHANFRAALERHADRPSITKLQAAYAAYKPRPSRKSGLERAFDRLLDEHPEIPEPLRNIHMDIWELDCYWPDHNVALELDGRPYHIVAQEIERDRRKDAYLLTHGIAPLRVTDERFGLDPLGALNDLKTLLQL